MWVGSLPNARGAVTKLAFAPDGRALYSGDMEGRILAWDIATHERKLLFRKPPVEAGNRGVWELWPTTNGRVLFSQGGALLDALDPDRGPLVSPPNGRWWKYVFPDGSRAVSNEENYSMGLWSTATGKQLKVPGALGAATGITHYDLLPDGSTLLTYGYGGAELTLWNVRTGKRLGEFDKVGSGIRPCAIAADGSAFAVGRDALVWVYDVAARALRHKLRCERKVNAVAVHPTGALVATAVYKVGVILWDAASGEQVRTFDWKIGKVEALAFAPDGLTCAAGGKGAFVVFDTEG